MSRSEHPNYPNPIIHEATCEIEFVTPTQWDPNWFTEYYLLTKERFSYFEPVNINASPNSLALAMQYKSKSEHVLILLTANKLIISHQPVYQGWKAMLKEIEFAWKSWKTLVEPSSISRIGLRYINRIEKSDLTENLGSWLKTTQYVPAGVLDLVQGFNSAVQTGIDEHNHLRVTVSEQVSSLKSTPAFAFDIDRIKIKEMSTAYDDVKFEVDRLHDDIWGVFSDAKTDRLERFLNGEML